MYFQCILPLSNMSESQTQSKMMMIISLQLLLAMQSKMLTISWQLKSICILHVSLTLHRSQSFFYFVPYGKDSHSLAGSANWHIVINPTPQVATNHEKIVSHKILLFCFHFREPSRKVGKSWDFFPNRFDPPSPYVGTKSDLYLFLCCVLALYRPFLWLW